MERLFDAPEEEPGAPAQAAGGPLAARLRPRTLDDFVGQEHLLGEGSALRTAIQSGEPHSMILYGPPGTGKTTLARMLAEYADAAFEELSAVEAGRQQVREVMERARERRRSATWAGGPPKPSAPIRPHSRATVLRGTGATSPILIAWGVSSTCPRSSR